MRKWGQAIALIVVASSACAFGAAWAAESFQADITTALAAGDMGHAEQLADAALAGGQLAPADRGHLLAARGAAREGLGRHDEALADLTQAIEMHFLPPADQAHALFARGTILDGLGRLDDAIGDYGGALLQEPHFAPALNNRADAYRRLGLFAQARRDYLASLSAANLQPEYSYYGLGQIAETSGDTEGARGFYSQAVAANPHYAPAADRLAALGGTPDVSAAAGIIHLRAPAPLAIAEVAQQPVLRPPHVLPASYGQEETEPGLRPALDATGKSALVQLGAWRTEEEAGEAWNRALERSGGLLRGLSPHIVAADLPGKGRYYRLRVASTPDGKLCSALQAKGVDCMPARD